MSRGESAARSAGGTALARDGMIVDGACGLATHIPQHAARLRCGEGLCAAGQELLPFGPSSISPVSLALTGLIFLLLTALAAFFSAAETAVLTVPQGRLRQLAGEGQRAATDLLWLTNQGNRFLATVKLALTAPILFATTLIVWQYGDWLAPLLGGSQWIAVVIVTTIATLLVVLLAKYAPVLLLHTWASRRRWSLPAPPRHGLAVLAIGVAARYLARLLFRPFGAARVLDTVPVVTEEDLKFQVDAAERGGVLAETEREMIHSIFELDDTLVREIMVPRVYVVAASSDRAVQEVLDRALAAGLSRMPVYADDMDHILGVFYVKDAVRALRQEGEQEVNLRQVLRPVHFVPETKRVAELLREMRQSKTHLAIVVDEYGGTAGLVTIEDILEEIVGEIQDEYDTEEAPVRHLSEREAIVDALAPLGQVNELLSLRLDADDVDTIGGFVYDRLGRVPEPGDEVVADGVRLTVVAIDGNRIKKVRILRPVPSPESTTSAEPAA